MSEIALKRLQTGILCTVIVTSVLALSQLVSAEEELKFNPQVTIPEVSFEILDYKEVRAREICKMAREKGYTEEECPILVAHLYTENGAFSEDRDGDHGCSLGMIQWNFCVHEGMKARAWVKLHPEWADWRYQVNFYLDQINLRREQYNSLHVAIESWNFGARPTYLKKVKSHVAFASSLLE